MSARRDADRLSRQRQREALDALSGRFEVASVSPDPFTVYIDGFNDPGDEVDGVEMQGFTYIVGTTGYYLMAGRQVLCFPTA